MTKKIFLSAGHSNVPGKDMGADGLDGLKEGILYFRRWLKTDSSF